MPSLTSENAADLELLRSAAVAAGIIASGYFRSPLKSWTKDNASPVSEADVVLDEYLEDVLMAARPDYGWLSEESVDDPARVDCQRCFVVDPIDGTRAFIRGDDYWSISLAVVDHGRPVAGVVYAPARDELFEASLGGGAFLNKRRLSGPDGGRKTPVMPAPAAVLNALDDLGVAYDKGPFIPSLALRLAEVANGSLDAAVARRGAQDWDIAAAALILAESGVFFEDVCLGTPLYNKPDTRHGALAAIGYKPLILQLPHVLRDIYGCPEPIATQPDTEPPA